MGKKVLIFIVATLMLVLMLGLLVACSNTDTPPVIDGDGTGVSPAPTPTPDQGSNNGGEDDPVVGPSGGTGVSPTPVVATVIELNETSVTIKLGDSLTLVATVLPENTTDKTVFWESSNESVAKVVNGAVTSVGTGVAIITATTENGKTAQCKVTVDGDAVIQYELTLDKSFYVVTGIEGRTDKLEIPFLHDGLRVIAINAEAFAGNTDIQQVVLPNSIEFIYSKAFINCTNLKTINLPESVKEIGVSAFENCVSLTNITIPYLTETISERAFYGCESLQTANISEGVKHINDRAFDGCVSIEKFEMPNTIETLGNMAFRHAESLRSITFSTQLTAIGNACFQYCVSLDNVELHQGIVKIGDSCFSYCSGMKNLSILGNVEILGNSSFYDCTGLENIYYASSRRGDLGLNNYVFYNAGTKGKGVTFTLAKDAFVPDRLFEPQEDKNRPNLVKFIVENGATEINYLANEEYNYLPYLVEIDLPDTIVSIKKGCFDNTAWWQAQPNGAVYIGNIFYGYKGSLTGKFEISSNTVCVAFGALQGQNPTELRIPFVGAIANGDKNTHFGYIFGAESEAVQVDYIPEELTNVIVKNCQYTISDVAFTDCSFAVMLDHHWGEWITTLEPTCQTVGSRYHICTICDYKAAEVIPVDPNAHNIATTWTKNKDNHWHKCTVAGCQKVFDVIGHSWSEWVTTLEPTCQTEGSRYHICTICEYKVTEAIAIDPNAHNIATTWTKNKDNHCHRCTIAGCQEVFDVIGHSWSEWVTTLEPTCQTEGSRYHICTICEYKVTEAIAIDPNAHNIATTWTKNKDNHWHKCTISGCEAILEAEAHSWNNEDTCTVCMYYKYQTLNATFDSASSSYTIAGYTGNVADVIIPATYKGYPVTSIADLAFRDCTSLTSVVIPDSVTTIGYRAFYNCDRLTSVTIGSGVTSIGDGAFAYCDRLTSVTIGSGVTTIGDYAFTNCTSLTSISVDENNPNYKSIDGNLYSKDGKTLIQYAIGKTATSFVIPDSVTTIDNYAFEDCDSLTSITIPGSVTTIGGSAFRGCSSLESLTIPFVGAKAGVTSSDNYQYPLGYLFGTSSYTGGVATRQEYYASMHSTTSTTYYIPSSLKSVTVTGGYIPTGAFYNCNNITNITLGDDVTGIGYEAFSGCTSLTSISVDENNPNYKSIDGNLYSKDEKTLIQYAIGKTATSFVVPDSVTTIGSYAFRYCTSLTSVTFGENSKLTTIGSSAFFGFTGLTSITIPNSVTSIGSSAFAYCTSLTSVTFGENSRLTTIGSYAFRYCTSLTSITIPDSVTRIGSYAFIGCSSLESMTIPFVGAKAGVTASSTYQYPLGYLFGTSSYTGGVATTQYYYGSSTSSTTSTTYYIPSSLKSVTVTGGYITRGAFYNCNNITIITIPDGVTSIGSSAFYNCTSLTDVYYTGDIAGWCGISFGSANANPMYYANNLYIDGKLVEGELVIPDSVTRIGGSAFSGCTSLTSIVIPDSVTTIGDYAFAYCTRLTSIVIPDSVIRIGESAFYKCTGLTSIVIPDSVTTIERYVFYNCDSLTSVTFEDPNGWHLTKLEGATSGTIMTILTLTDASTNATYFKGAYYNYYWYKL